MRRYLFGSDIEIQSTSKAAVLVVGSGIAGLYSALCLDGTLKCVVLAKDGIEESDSYLAQGGIASAFKEGDSPSFHFDDTVVAGAGLCNKEAVRVLVEEGPKEIKNLLSFNVPFDKDENGRLAAGREGGHHRNRILHAKGDATGKEIIKSLYAEALKRNNISFMSGVFLVDILTNDGGVCGAVIYKEGFHKILCNNIILCTGGIGKLYSRTTNAKIATGDGQAAALRAGAKLKDMEFVQFHPTGLYGRQNDGRVFLISEAVRGEGGFLRGRDGERFMLGRHPMAELAPRDIVARGIAYEMEKTGQEYVSLDITKKTGEELSKRFPTIYTECSKRGIDISKQYIPVCPVQHYMMGGIKTNLDGMTEVPGLYACGEAACTGVHGANRLASNSMLECLVFGRRAAQSIKTERENENFVSPRPGCRLSSLPGNTSAQAVKIRINKIMDSDCWVVRSKKDLEKGASQLSEIKGGLEHAKLPDREWMEAYNMAVVSYKIMKSALERVKSVGAHYRKD